MLFNHAYFSIDGDSVVLLLPKTLGDSSNRMRFLLGRGYDKEPISLSNSMKSEDIKNGIPFRAVSITDDSNVYEGILKGTIEKRKNDYISKHWDEYNHVIDDNLYEQFIIKSGIPEDRILDRKNLIVFIRDVVKDELNGVAPKYNNEEMLQVLIDNNIIALPYDEAVQQSATAPEQPVDTSANQQAQAATQSSTAQPTDPAAPVNRGAANSTVINNGFINPVIPPVQNVGGNPVYQNAGDGEVEVDLSLEATPMNDEVLKRRILENDKRKEAYRIDVMPADARICS